MKLAIEVTTCGNLRAGVGYYTEHLVDAVLAARQPDDEVVLLSNRTPAAELAERWAPHLRVAGKSIRAVWMQTDMPRLLAECGADVGLFPNYVVPFASPCPSIVVVHDLALLRLPHTFTARKRLAMIPLLQRSVATASVVATVSEASCADIVALLGVDRARIEILRGAPHPFCTPATQERIRAVRALHGITRPYLLTVGTLEPRKNLPTLLRAFDELASKLPEHELVVVGGRGWKDRPLMRALHEHQTRVRWLGYVPQDELAALYTGADVFVYPSTMEGFGLPVLEAMACGAPVVASDVPALREVGGTVARLVPPTDASAFANAILETLADAAQRRDAGRVRAREFSWLDTANTLWDRARRTVPQRIYQVPAAINSRDANLIELGRPPASLSTREWSLLATVTYADLFDSPLPTHNMQNTTIGFAIDEATTHQLSTGALSSLIKVHPSGFVGLSGREHLVESMPRRIEKTRKQLDEHRPLLSILGALPYVRALTLSGGLAHDNPGAHNDIDLFVIAAGGRAYTAYTLLFLATKLTGTRRVVCPNYLVDENELAVAYNRDLFTAHQLASARPVSGQGVYETWCKMNHDWVANFFPGFAPAQAGAMTNVGERSPLQSIQRAIEFIATPLAPTIESVLRWGWRLRWRPLAAKSTRGDVVLGDGILKLHLSDYRKRVLARFGERLEAMRRQVDSV